MFKIQKIELILSCLNDQQVFVKLLFENNIQVYFEKLEFHEYWDKAGLKSDIVKHNACQTKVHFLDCSNSCE